MSMLWNEALDVLGVSYSTLRRYVKNGKIRTSRYNMPHRMKNTNYWDEDVYALVGRKIMRKAGSRSVVAYCRVNGKTKEDESQMAMQKKILETYISARGARIERVYEDRASGNEFREKFRPGWHELIRDVMLGNVGVLLLHTKDRFARFGWEGYETILKYYDVEVIVLSAYNEDVYYQAEQSEDLAVELHKLKMERVKPTFKKK